MRISTRSRYGLRFMVELAANYDNGVMYKKDIAKSQGISEKYLSQILVTLKAAGLVVGFRGVNGGYILAKSPDEITLKDIVAVLEGDLALVDCVNGSAKCPRESICVTQEVWAMVGEAVSDALTSMTLSELVARCSLKMQEQIEMYYI